MAPNPGTGTCMSPNFAVLTTIFAFVRAFRMLLMFDEAKESNLIYRKAIYPPSSYGDMLAKSVWRK